MMELILTTPIEELTPKLIAFNSAEITAQLKPRLEIYKNMAYTEDQMTAAKQDRATLNKLKAAIEDERKRIKKYYNQPYDKFEQEIKQITGLIDETTAVIDNQIKAFEDVQKVEKRAQIIEFWNQNIGDLANLINVENVFSDQWLNATYSLKKVKEDITNFIAKINQDLAVITSLNFKHETHLKDFYLKTYDLAATMQEKTRLEENEKRLAELSQKQAQVQAKTTPIEVEAMPKQEVKQVDFRVWATREQLNAIKEFLVKNEIKYGKVPMEEKI